MTLYSSAEYTTKVGRNYRTGVRKGDKAPEPAIAILPETSCAAAFSIMLEQVASVIVTHRQIIMESDDERGPHQMRVGLRRLRTLLRALQPAAHFPSIRELDHLAAEVARSVGELRDADVLIGSIYKRVSEATGEPFLEALERALCEHRTSMQHQVRSMLRGRRWRRLQQQLSLPPRQLEGVPDLEQPIKPYATELLSKRWRKLRKIGRNLEKLNVEQRHEMRKALKQFRYLTEFFAPIYQREKDASSFLKHLKELQHIFGYMTDVHMAAQLPQILEGARESALYGAHYLIGWHQAEAQHVWKRVGKMWKKAQKTPRFWAN